MTKSTDTFSEWWETHKPELPQGFVANIVNIGLEHVVLGIAQDAWNEARLVGVYAGLENMEQRLAKARDPDMECKHCHHVGPAAEHTDRYFPGDRQNPPEHPGWWCANCNHFTRTDLPEIFR